MKVIALRPVEEFLESLDPLLRADVESLVELLVTHGHLLRMPYVKPIGGGLWELRYTDRPQIRILYAFHEGAAVLLLAFKKQRAATRREDIELALRRLKGYYA